MKKYTAEIQEYIIKNCKDKKAKCFVQEINKKFNTNFTVTSLRTYLCSVLKIRLKSHTINKPKKLYNQRKVGDLREKKGLIQIKVAEPNVWKQYQVYLWEQNHNDTVKKGEVVVFLDGNNRNFEINNLHKVNRSILLIRNLRYKGLKGLVGYQLAELKRIIAIKKRKVAHKKNELCKNNVI